MRLRSRPTSFSSAHSFFLIILSLLVVIASLGHWKSQAAVQAGFAETDITPKLTDDNPVWLAGYGTGRPAKGIHDPLKVRAVVLGDGKKKIALVCTDLVGLQYPEVLKIRAGLVAAGLDYVLVSSTHNHEGPDVIGIWGKTYISRGVDDAYLNVVVAKTIEAVKAADKDRVEVIASYGTADDPTLIRDSREPEVIDGTLRVLKFQNAETGKNHGILVQWNCHPEALGSKNQQLTADFPHVTVAELKKKYGCSVAYFTGAIGGLLAPPTGRVADKDGKLFQKDGTFEFAAAYGVEVSRLAIKAIESAGPVVIEPIRVSAKRMFLPVQNAYYRAGHTAGVLKRKAVVWTGDVNKAGPELGLQHITETMAVETEIAYLQLGEVGVAAIPGEIYPELVYGKIQDPVDPGADFQDAKKEKSVSQILPTKKWLLLGMANDEVGYIIPKRQWDRQKPFAYGRKKSQYGEVNSCGPETAGHVMRALAECVKKMPQK